jgi:hypothetical protein
MKEVHHDCYEDGCQAVWAGEGTCGVANAPGGEGPVGEGLGGRGEDVRCSASKEQKA